MPDFSSSMYSVQWYKKKAERDKFHVRTEDTPREAVDFLREEYADDLAIDGEMICTMYCTVCEERRRTYCCNPGLDTCLYVCEKGHVYANRVRHIRSEIFNVKPSQKAITQHRGRGNKSPLINRFS